MREAAVWTGAQAATKTRGRLADPCRIDLRARLVRSGGEVRVADMFYIRETESQCFELIMIEDKRRKGDLAPQHVTNAGLSLDRQPVGLQCRKYRGRLCAPMSPSPARDRQRAPAVWPLTGLQGRAGGRRGACTAS